MLKEKKLLLVIANLFAASKSALFQS